jgi:hypothetical protein
VLRGRKNNKALDLRRVAAAALAAALEDDATPPRPEHRSAGRSILTGAAVGAAGGLAWMAARGGLPDLSGIRDRVFDRLDDLGLLDEDEPDDDADFEDEDEADEDEAYEDDDEGYEDDDDEAYEDDDVQAADSSHGSR